MRLLPVINCWLEALGGLFYPNVCQCCRAEQAGVGEGFVGRECRRQIRWCRDPVCSKCGLPYEGSFSGPFECANCRALRLEFDWARAAVRASGVVLEVIHRYKYRRERWFEPFLGGLLVEAAEPCLRPCDWDAVVPVPLHPVKEREREFNQALCLARWLGRAAGLPLASGFLQRIYATPTQTHLDRRKRQENVRGAFRLRKGRDVAGKRVILVDDVLTTGATTSECARVLKECGALEVGVWTVARGV